MYVKWYNQRIIIDARLFMKTYFSKKLECDQCTTPFDRDVFNQKLNEKGPDIHYKCSNCGADYKLSNIFIWVGVIVTMNAVVLGAPDLMDKNPVFLGIAVIACFRLFYQFRKYFSYFRHIK